MLAKKSQNRIWDKEIISESAEMETRGKPQLLMSLIVLSMLFSQMLAWPLFEARFLRVPLEEESEVDRTSFKADTDILRNVFPENGSYSHSTALQVSMGRGFIQPDILQVLQLHMILMNARHADELFASDFISVLDQLPKKKYLRSLIENGDSNSISENQRPSKRKADAIIGHYYAQLQRRKALKKWLWKQIVTQVKKKLGNYKL
ncbi:VIP peptide [Pteropus alecto]|uniref:VIP peptide n=1 Tax=Pteropus alecto TaxID=9402 RepID=L5KDA4_PTEAL|nr:VIP peptide [Pteropus alecto]